MSESVIHFRDDRVLRYLARLVFCDFLLVLVSLWCACPSGFAQEAHVAQWRSYGGDPGGTRFSALKEINRHNVSKLRTAWTYHTGELELMREARITGSGFACTPLVVDGVMYLSTHSSRVIALDAENGVELWKYDAQEGRRKEDRRFQPHRGVSYWEGPSRDGESVDRRILFGTVDARLIALDAETGRPRPDFGTRKDGSVDLRIGVADRFPDSFYAVTSPPAIHKDLVITGSRVQEGPPSLGPSGDVRAYNVRTGELVWQFHTVPREGEIGHESWEGESWKDRSGANVWGVMSVDDERGIVFLPIGSPSYDYYAGDRKGHNLFGNTLVALNAESGKLRWYYQTVHHDIWDYDLPAQPNLITVNRGGRSIPAVALVTKMGFVFILDRLTGQPLFPVEERAVPRSTVPGEETWPTQPFPLKPPSLIRSKITKEDISEVTPESKRYCMEIFEKVRHEGMYTPLGLSPTLFYPSTLGGGNWHGGAFDPTTGLLYVNVNEIGVIHNLEPDSDIPKSYRLVRKKLDDWYFTDRNGWPCQKPPWATLNAIDVSSGELVWKVPLGVVEELVARGIGTTGAKNIGGAIVTGGGLVFIAGTADQRFRAFDAKTGKELWVTKLEASGHSTPVTFRGKKSGRQYVVVAAGGGGFASKASDPLGDSVTAFALPDSVQ